MPAHVANGQPADENGALDWTTGIWLVMILVIIFLLLYFAKYDLLVLLSITIVLRLYTFFFNWLTNSSAGPGSWLRFSAPQIPPK